MPRNGLLRRFWTDLAALSLLAVLGALVLFDMYWLGHTAYYAANIDTTAASERNLVLTRLVGELLALLLAVGWLAYRLVQGSYRNLRNAN